MILGVTTEAMIGNFHFSVTMHSYTSKVTYTLFLTWLCGAVKSAMENHICSYNYTNCMHTVFEMAQLKAHVQ